MAGSKRRHTDTDNPDSQPTWDGNTITMRKWLNDICILDIGRLEQNEINHQAVTSLIGNMRTLINNQTFADVVFIVEQKPIYGHKAILAAQCEHFKTMFLNGMKEST